jgi:hypothetical protein
MKKRGYQQLRFQVADNPTSTHPWIVERPNLSESRLSRYFSLADSSPPLGYNCRMKKPAVLILLGVVFCTLVQAQTVTVTADAGPDESMSQTYMAFDRDCRNLVNKRADPTEAIAACKKVADEADRFAPQSHFSTRRAAYVFYTIALIQGKKAQDAVMVGNKAAVVLLVA